MRKIVISAIAAFIHALTASLFTPWIFTKSIFYADSKWIAVLCLFTVLAVLYGFYRLLAELAGRNHQVIKWMVYSFIYFLILAVFFYLVYPVQSVGGDVDYFFTLALDYGINWDLHYVSSLFYIVPMIIFPMYISPSVFEMLMISMCVGYFVYRGSVYIKRWYFLYLPFLLIPFIFYAHFINRPPLYVSAYLFFITLLLFDYYERKKLTCIKLIVICAMGGLLSRWRYEGIYLIFMIPLWLIFIYGNNKKNKKDFAKYLVYMICASFIIHIPQNIGTTWNDSDYNETRLMPFLYYTIPNMIYAGMNVDYNDNDFIQIDRVMDLERTQEIISGKGENMLEGLWVTWEGGIREEYSKEEYQCFIDASLRIMVRKWPYLIKSKILAFRYTASNQVPYHVETLIMKDYIKEHYYLTDKQDAILHLYTKNAKEAEVEQRKAYNTILSDYPIGNERTSFWGILKRLQWNLYLPLALGLMEIIYTIRRKKWMEASILISVAMHTGIVFLMAPASYFHYYIVMYTMAYVMLVVLILRKTRR